MADQETEARWAELRRIEAEKMKAARNLAGHDENKANLAYLPITKPRGFSRDPNVVMQSAERLANVSIMFCLLGIIFGIFNSVFGAISSGAGGGVVIAMIFSIINLFGIGAAAITGVVALGCTAVFARRTKRKVKPIIITACTSLILVVLYHLVQEAILTL